MTGGSAGVEIDAPAIRRIIDGAHNGFLGANAVRGLLRSAQVPHVEERIVDEREGALQNARELEFPLAMKVVGPLHKSEVGGVVLNVSDPERAAEVCQQLMAIDGAIGVAMQPMVEGVELFVGGFRDPNFGHLVFVGLGGIFVEVLGDVQAGLVPLDRSEIRFMLRKLRGYPLFAGTRGGPGVDEDSFSDIVLRVSALLELAPEIAEIDLNPLMGQGQVIVSVDARIKVDA